MVVVTCVCLVNFLDFVDVLFQSGVFEYVLFYGGLSPFYVGVEFGGLVTYLCKTYLCTPRKLFRGVTNEGATDVWEFQRSPSRILSCMVDICYTLHNHVEVSCENSIIDWMDWGGGRLSVTPSEESVELVPSLSNSGCSEIPPPPVTHSVSKGMHAW